MQQSLRSGSITTVYVIGYMRYRAQMFYPLFILIPQISMTIVMIKKRGSDTLLGLAIVMPISIFLICPEEEMLLICSPLIIALVIFLVSQVLGEYLKRISSII